MPPGKRKTVPTTQRQTRQNTKNNNDKASNITTLGENKLTLTPEAFFRESPTVGSADQRTLPSNSWDRVAYNNHHDI